MIKTDYSRIAEYCGLTPQGVRMIMRGVQKPSSDTLFKISESVGINPAFLFNHPDGLTPDQVILERFKYASEAV